MGSTKCSAAELRPLSASDAAKVFGGTKSKTDSTEKPIYLKFTLKEVLISGLVS